MTLGEAFRAWLKVRDENRARRERATWLDLEADVRELDRRVTEAEEKTAQRESSRALQLVVALLLVAFATPASAQEATREYAAKVVSCWDGDTCTLEIVEPASSVFAAFDLVHHEAVRLCGVNAPELKGETIDAARRSRDALLAWIKAAKKMTFRPALKNGRADREKYGRLLGWLVADGVVLNELLVTSGLAVRYIECAE